MRFQVFSNDLRPDGLDLKGAYLFGADTIPLQSTQSIRTRDGEIECKRKSSDSAGLSLLWKVEGSGRIFLPTTRLPERKEPYILNVELARARLMQITLKREDWSLFEEGNASTALGREAQALFVEALQHINDPNRAALLADQSLGKAFEYSEKLALRNADLALAARLNNKGLGRHSLGISIDPVWLDDDGYRRLLLELFGYVTIPIRWSQIEPHQGQYDFSVVDRCIEHLSGHRLAVCAGPILRFTRDDLPAWLIDGQFEFGRIREIAYGFVSRMVSRYAKYIHSWRLVSGLHAENEFDFSFEQIIEMTRTACLAARAADSNSKKMVELLYPWGEYYAFNRNTIPPLVYMDMLIQSGISFDAFSLMMHFGKDRPGMHIRDMMQISSRLDCFAQVAKPVHISGLAVPETVSEEEGSCGGTWHQPWNQEVQADWVDQMYRIALGKSFIQSITWSYLADCPSMEIPSAGLLSSKLYPKKALLVLARLQKAIMNRKS